MDSNVSYPAAKRRRTSRSASESRSRSPSRTPPTRSRRDSPRRDRSRSYSRSRSRSPPCRRRRSPSHSSEYESRDGSRYKSRSRSPAVQDQAKTSEPSRRGLNFIPLHTIPRAHARGISCAKFSPDGALLATASADATINIYSVPTNPQPSSSTSSIKQEPDSDTTSSANTFKHIRTLRGHLSGINALSWSPVSNGTTTSSSSPFPASDAPSSTSANTTTAKFYTLASASDDKTILLWSPLSSDLPISPSPLTGHSNYVSTLSFSPKGNMLVSGSYDEAVFLWDVRSGRLMRQLPAHSDPVGGVDFISDGTMVCSCSTDGLIRIWDSGTGQCLRTLVDENRKGVTGVLWTRNGSYLLAWYLDGCVRLWDYIRGRCVKTYTGHSVKEFGVGGVIGTYYEEIGAATEAQQQQQAAFVASGSEDGDLVLWDVTTKEVLWRGEGHRDVVLGVDYCTPHAVEGARGLLVSVGKDRDVRIWVEDVDEVVVQRRQAAVLAAKQRKGGKGDGYVNGDAGGYAVDEDEDVDAQIMEMEAEHDDDRGEGMELDEQVAVNGHHTMEVDTAA